MNQIKVRLPDDLLELLDELVREFDGTQSRSSIVRDAVYEYLARRELTRKAKTGFLTLQEFVDERDRLWRSRD